MKDQLIDLSPDQRVVALRHVGSLVEAAHHLYEEIKADQLTEDMRGTLLGLCEFELVGAGEVLGYAANLAAELEERHGEIRAANIRIRELERQLGAGRTTDGLRELIHRLHENVQRWWKTDGFGHVHKFGFGAWGACKIELCCMLFGPDDRHGDTPVTAKQRYEEWLAALPYDLHHDPREQEPDLLDTPKNRALLTALITSRFPSARITAWHNRSARLAPNELWELHQVEFFVYDLADLEEPGASEASPQAAGQDTGQEVRIGEGER